MEVYFLDSHFRGNDNKGSPSAVKAIPLPASLRSQTASPARGEASYFRRLKVSQPKTRGNLRGYPEMDNRALTPMPLPTVLLYPNG